MLKRQSILIGIALVLLSRGVAYSEGKGEAAADKKDESFIMTVRGPIAASELGQTLAHEHVVGSFTKKDQIASYDRDVVVKTMLPLLKAVKEQGFTALVEPTPVDLSRDVEVLRRLAELADMHILTNTGNYGAFGDKLLLPYGLTENADQLAARWVKEWQEGIDGTDIKPGFIKIAVDKGPLSDIDRKLAQAAARAHLQTGLTIYRHTGEAVAALGVREAVRGEGAHPSALVVVHSDEIADQDVHFQIAEAGAWVAYDHVGRPNLPLEKHVELITEMLKRGFRDRLLISHDSVWFDVSDPEGWMQFGKARLHPDPALGGAPWATVIVDQLMPALEKAGVSKGDIRKLLVNNPAEALAIRVRKQ